MRNRVPIACVTLAAAALAACTLSSEAPLPPAPTPDELARETYERIVRGANHLLEGDQLGYFGSNDDLERVRVRCRADVCAAGLVRSADLSAFTVGDVDLDLLGERRGVNLVVERASDEYADTHVYGGWLDHSLFATETSLLKHAIFPDRGATVVFNYSVGFSTGENPGAVDGSALWEGLMIGREMRASPSRGQVVLGNADVTVEFGAGGVTADVEFTEIANAETGEPRGDMAWRGMAVEAGGFAEREALDDTISGRFYGPGEEEVGGVFERDGVAGVFGGRRAAE